MPSNELSCLLEKISLYLLEYLGKEVMKELNMAFKSIGQKYGFVSAGDVYRQEIADAQAKAKKLINEERQKAERRQGTASQVRRRDEDQPQDQDRRVLQHEHGQRR